MGGDGGHPANWGELERGLAGALIVPESPEYEGAHRSFIARFDDIHPQAVVRCVDAADVVTALAFAFRYGIDVAVRSGGHSVAGFSSTRGILIDVSPMKSVRIADGLAHVGAGTRLGEMYEQLLIAGLTVPAGTCPSVGIAGLTLGGGFGLLGRTYGLTLDHLVQATVVLADGQIAECDEGHDQDLFWALRGAGAGNFGIVTRLTFRPVKAPARLTDFRLTWPFADAGSVIRAWQGWAPLAADELHAEVTLSANGNPDEPPRLDMQGSAMADESATHLLLNELVSRAGAAPSFDVFHESSYRESIAFHGEQSVSEALVEQTPNGPLIRQGYRCTKSEFFDRLLPDSAVMALLTNLERSRRPGEVRSLYFAPWGGAYNRRPADASAFTHRDQLFLIEHSAFVDPRSPEREKRTADAWVRRSWASVHDYGSGRVYPCFPDLELDRWAGAYYGDNLARVLRVKATYDPDGRFSTPPALAPNASSARP